MSSQAATRAELMRRLSILSTEELLSFLKDETIFEIAEAYFEKLNNDAQSSANLKACGHIAPSTATPSRSPATDRAKRPLNAFMAFRSYYLKLFPDVQQKTASGFLTTLWNKDPFRNKWALIAKVYSFIRDEIGKENVVLAYFLSVSCPVMKIIAPKRYLQALGWSIENDENSPQRLTQMDTAYEDDLAKNQSDDFPNTEMELLTSILNIGYLPEESFELLQRMSMNDSGIITTSSPVSNKLPLPYTKEKIDFVNTIRSNPIGATMELIGSEYDEQTIAALGVKSHDVHDINVIGHLPLQISYPDPGLHYNYSTSHAQIPTESHSMMQFGQIPDHETFDIDSPWDLDAILGHGQTEGERTINLQASPAYDHQDDFHYLF